MFEKRCIPVSSHVKAIDSVPAYGDYCVCLGRKIAWIRRSKGFSQKRLAELCGISSSYLAKIEGAKGSLGTTLQILYLIAGVLQVDLGVLLSHTADDYHRMRLFKIKRKVSCYETEHDHSM